MKATSAEKGVYDWVEKSFNLTREKIESDDLKRKSAERLIDAAKDGRLTFGENTAIYTLKYPVGNVMEVTFNARIKAKTLMSMQTADGMAKLLKLFEDCMNLPAAIIGDLDSYDFSTMDKFFAFLE
jgi:hypothetical protein